jgi:tetratricopeptide (TPR) repeat protein
MIREIAEKALRIDPSDRKAHALLGSVAAAYDYDWKIASEQFSLSMAGGHQLSDVRIRYASFYLLPMGRFEEVIREEEKEVESDPLNIVSRAIQCYHLRFAGQYDRALEAAQKALELDDNHWLILVMMAEVLVGMGKFEEALSMAERSYRLAPFDPRPLGLLAGLLARRGDTERAKQIRDQLNPMAMGSIGLLLYNLLISDIEAAADCFHHAIERREPLAVIYASVQLLAPLRSNKRWPLLADMMNLPGHIAVGTGTG